MPQDITYNCPLEEQSECLCSFECVSECMDICHSDCEDACISDCIDYCESDFCVFDSEPAPDNYDYTLSVMVSNVEPPPYTGGTGGDPRNAAGTFRYITNYAKSAVTYYACNKYLFYRQPGVKFDFMHTTVQSGTCVVCYYPYTDANVPSIGKSVKVYIQDSGSPFTSLTLTVTADFTTSSFTWVDSYYTDNGSYPYGYYAPFEDGLLNSLTGDDQWRDGNNASSLTISNSDYTALQLPGDAGNKPSLTYNQWPPCSKCVISGGISTIYKTFKIKRPKIVTSRKSTVTTIGFNGKLNSIEIVDWSGKLSDLYLNAMTVSEFQSLMRWPNSHERIEGAKAYFGYTTLTVHCIDGITTWPPDYPFE